MKKVIVLLVLVLFLPGCATTHYYPRHNYPSDYTGFAPSRLSQLSLGMTKQEVRNTLGHPSTVRGAVSTSYGNIELWEYKEYMPSEGIEFPDNPFLPGKKVINYWLINTYWVEFLNEKLYKWGKAGDWQPPADIIIEER